MDAILNFLADWLMPAAPWICRAYARGYWVDGLLKGAALGVASGGVLAYVVLLLARVALWLIRKLRLGLIRKKDQR